MQIEGWRRHWSLTQHRVNLTAMMSLMVEEMADRGWCFFQVLSFLAVRIAEGPPEEPCLQTPTKCFDWCILIDPG